MKRIAVIITMAIFAIGFYATPGITQALAPIGPIGDNNFKEMGKGNGVVDTGDIAVNVDVTQTEEYQTATDDLVKFLAGDDLDRVLFTGDGASYDEVVADAMNKVAVTVDTILQAGKENYDINTSKYLARKALLALNDYLTSNDHVSCLCPRKIQIETEQDAKKLGEIIVSLVNTTHKAAAGIMGLISYRKTGLAILEDTRVVGGDELEKLLSSINEIGQGSQKELAQYPRNL